MNNKPSFEAFLIAPCGMNCGICNGYLRAKKPCSGCQGDDRHKPAYCVGCRIKHCVTREQTPTIACVDCPEFPCKRLKQLDKRYRTKYRMSMLENLEQIKNLGMEAFIQHECLRWTCAKCGGIICVHNGACYQCGEKHAELGISADTNAA